MEKLLFSKLTKADLAKFVSLEDQGIKNHNWLNVESVSVELHEAQQLQYL